MIAISIDNIIKKYHLKEELILAINNLSYNFEYGKMYAIMGHSGSGKSTLVQCLGLLDKIDSGKIYIDGKDISKITMKEQNALRNRKIGFIFQSYYLNNTMKAYENVMLPMLINGDYNSLDLRKKSKDLLCEVSLGERINHYPKELSGGEQQRVAIARAIANNPSIILADEPTGNLDEENEKYILEKLKKMSEEGKCVIIVSHNNIVKEYADVVINMRKGKFLESKNEI
ncbi:MAG: ABC transporter ATP-binding protein [Bacilli bacterium]|nr:ABC transporter ATP-binding protein [Bacilli bacterium]